MFLQANKADEGIVSVGLSVYACMYAICIIPHLQANDLSLIV